MAHFHLASYNLYQFAEPGTFWYEIDEANVTQYDVFNQHHIEETDRLVSSDHAPVRARIEAGGD